MRAAPRRTARVSAMAVAASRVATVTKQAAGGLEVQVALGIDGSGSVEWCARSLREISLKMRCTRAAFRLQALVHLLSNSSSEPTSIRIAATPHPSKCNPGKTPWLQEVWKS